MTEFTHVELEWVKGRIENWIRFGRTEEEHLIDSRRRVVSFAPGSIFAFVRWVANDYGTTLSRIDILRAVRPGEPFSTVSHVRPGGESLLQLSGWRKVEKVLQAIDAVAALGIDPADAAPDHWRHVQNRLSAGERAALVAATIGEKPVLRFVWNASESVPIGLYRVQPADRLIVTDLVVAFPPEGLATRLAEGGYLPRGIPLIKRVLALPGQVVCREKLTITVDGIEMGCASVTAAARALPSWQGCRTLAQGQVFLMNWDEPASLDGRYFGPLPLATIVGRAVPLWTFEEE